MKNITLTLFLLCYTSAVFSAVPEDGIYILLSSAEGNLSNQKILTQFDKLPHLIIVNGELISQKGDFFYPSDCNTMRTGGKAHLDLSQTAAVKTEEGVFLLGKEFSIVSGEPGISETYWYTYWFTYLSPEMITDYSLYGRDIVYGILRFDTPTEAVYSLTSAQAFFTGEGLNVSSCIVRETARLVKIQ